MLWLPRTGKFILLLIKLSFLTLTLYIFTLLPIYPMAKTRQMQRESDINKARTRGAKKLARDGVDAAPVPPPKAKQRDQTIDSVEIAVPVRTRRNKRMPKVVEPPPQPHDVLKAGLSLIRDYSSDIVKPDVVDSFINEVEDGLSRDELRGLFGAIMGAEDEDARHEADERLAKRIRELEMADDFDIERRHTIDDDSASRQPHTNNPGSKCPALQSEKRFTAVTSGKPKPNTPKKILKKYNLPLPSAPSPSPSPSPSPKPYRRRELPSSSVPPSSPSFRLGRTGIVYPSSPALDVEMADGGNGVHTEDEKEEVIQEVNQGEEQQQQQQEEQAEDVEDEDEGADEDGEEEVGDENEQDEEEELVDVIEEDDEEELEDENEEDEEEVEDGDEDENENENEFEENQEKEGEEENKNEVEEQMDQDQDQDQNQDQMPDDIHEDICPSTPRVRKRTRPSHVEGKSKAPAPARLSRPSHTTVNANVLTPPAHPSANSSRGPPKSKLLTVAGDSRGADEEEQADESTCSTDTADKTGGKSGRVSREVIQEAEAIKQQYNDALLALSQKSGKSLSGLHSIIGDVVKSTRKVNVWNVYQIWAAHWDGKNIDKAEEGDDDDETGSEDDDTDAKKRRDGKRKEYTRCIRDEYNRRWENSDYTTKEEEFDDVLEWYRLSLKEQSRGQRDQGMTSKQLQAHAKPFNDR
ncbi:hypothetical protein F5890DRAFT_1478836, partial [Lentinula detonsa]